jgi:hypothetical protein
MEEEETKKAEEPPAPVAKIKEAVDLDDPRSVALDIIEQKQQRHVVNDIQTTDKVVGKLVNLEDIPPALLASSQVFVAYL